MLKRKRQVKPFGAEIRTGSVGGILARLYRTILHDLGITTDRYEALMTRYIQKAQLDPNRKDKAAARAGLSKELLKESMTWKTLIKGINFLGVLRIDIRIGLHHANGRVTQHGIDIVLDEVDEETKGEGADE